MIIQQLMNITKFMNWCSKKLNVYDYFPFPLSRKDIFSKMWAKNSF